jgi:SAM-dependent methyltransferase
MSDHAAGIHLPQTPQLERLFLEKHGPPEEVGWAPRRRFDAKYYLPSDVYEALVESLVTKGVSWLDVGGGHAIFPENPRLATRLVSVCSRVVAADPSGNVRLNTFVHETVQSPLELYRSAIPFDLATMRMVVEHVEHPEAFVGALARLVRPGGIAVVFTVNRWSPLTILSRWVPFRWHHTLKQAIWGSDEEGPFDEADTFPVHDKMNTRATLARLFAAAEFEEVMFAKLDDVSLFGRFPFLNRLELTARQAIHRIGLSYPENCLLAVYRRSAESHRAMLRSKDSQ